MKKVKNERKLTVGYQFQNRVRSQIVQAPEIKLAGKWLLESGFVQGQKVTIVVQKNKLIITPDENE